MQNHPVICIFCLKEKDESDEHVVPLALGGSLVIKRVCKCCNSKLGSRVDAPLINHLGIALHRYSHQLSGNHGPPPDVIMRVINRGTNVTKTGEKLRIEKHSEGNYVPRFIPRKSTKIAEDGTKWLNVSLDERDIDQLRKILSRARIDAGLQPLVGADLQKVVDQAWATAEITEHRDVISTLNIDMTSLEQDFRLGILKIAYEMAFQWFGEPFLSRAEAQEMRQVIRYEKNLRESDLRCGFRIGNADPFRLWDHDHSHLALSTKLGGDIIIAVRLFQEIVCDVSIGPAGNNEAGHFHRFDFIKKSDTATSIRFQHIKKRWRISLHLSSGNIPIAYLVAERNYSGK